MQPARSDSAPLPHATMLETVRGTTSPMRILLLLAVLMPMALAAWFAWYQRSAVLTDVQNTAQRSVIALEEHAANVLQTHTLILYHIASAIRGRGAEQISSDMQLRKTLSDFAESFEQVALIGIADAEGRLLLSSVSAAVEGKMVSDRDFFIAHKSGATKGIFFSEPYIGRMNGIRQFALSIARTNASGEFDGVIYAAVSLDYFTRFWEQFAPSDGYLIPMIRSDGALMVRYPAQNNPEWLDPNGPFMQHINHAPRNVYTAVSQVDGIERINAYTRIKTYPLYVSYSVETRAALQEWRKDVLPASLMAVMISAALGALWMALLRQSHQRRLAAVKWRAVAHDLEAEIARRENAEEALRQSQKMEAIGQLTGGIAHDFNNHLAGVSGNLELMRIRLEQDRDFDIRPYIDAAESGTDRAAKLTQRLLTFSRRQTLAPRSTDTNRLILSLAELIRGTVGPAIAVSTVLTEGLPPALCDPNQLENALLNLAINARDAMPDGGKLIISTCNTELDEATAASYDQLAGGSYVTIRISDTGQGMSEEVLRRACDPFFTTKPVGQGTGLGLSIVHGFVKQSRGHVQLFSKEGKGTTVEIFLPVDPEVATGIRGSGESQTVPRAKLRATVLVVDDKADLRNVIAEMLNVIGCKTLQAGTGGEAMEILASSDPIDLLVTDIGLPGGMNGMQLAQNARATRQELKVLFITGYAADSIPHDLPLGGNSRLLNKPFAMEALAATVTAMLALGDTH